MIPWNSFRRITVVNAVVLSFALSAGAAAGQVLTVLPVNVFLAPGQKAATMTVTNRGTSETAIQIRPYAWNQADGNDQLEATHKLEVSPPIASIAPGASQLVRLILRDVPGDREVTYRVLLDQLPSTSEVGVVQVVFRLSIPVFSQPANRGHRQLQFHIERESGQLYLVGRNDGLCHEAIRDIALYTADGTRLAPDNGASPYILPGATRRWRIVVPSSMSLPNDTLKFTARDDSGAIAEQVRVVSKP
jgi:fimbrial chaperone protein